MNTNTARKARKGTPTSTVTDLLTKAQRGDLTGMQLAIMERLSNESRQRKHVKNQKAKGAKTGKRPRTGMDINNREEQVADQVEYIESRGGTVVFTYSEPHTSAYKRQRIKQDDGTYIYRVVRPVYEAMLKDLARGIAPNGERLDGIMCPDLDRLTRDNRDLEDSIDVVTHYRRPILDLSGALDLLTTNGQTNARVVVAFKNAQSADTARRVARKHKALQREGIPTGGTRPFGWNEDKRTLHPVEAPLLKDAVKQILTGATCHAICADWNRKQITTARGNKWRAVNLKAVLRNPRMCGYRMVTVHNVADENETLSRHVEIHYGIDGKPTKGQWTRMITPKQWETLLELIGEKPSRGDGSNARKYLGVGTMRCGKNDCDTPLRAMKSPPSRNKSEGHFDYICPSKGDGGCGGTRIDGPGADKAVSELVITMYEQQATRLKAKAKPEPWPLQAQLDRVNEDIAAAKAARKAETITAARYYADLGEYEAEKRELLNDRASHTQRTQVITAAPPTLRADWFKPEEEGGLTLAQRRMYIERALSAVILLPCPYRGAKPEARLKPIPTDLNN